MGTILGIFVILKIFWFFWKFSQTWPSMEHWAEKIRKNCPKTCSKNVWTLLGTISGIFGILKNFWFFWKVSKTWHSMKHWAKKNSEKLPQNKFKARVNNFGNVFGHSLEFSKMIFLKTFEDTTLHGALGKFFFRKNCPKTCSKHVWTLLGTILGILGFLKKIDFFENFRRHDPPWSTGHFFFSEKLPQNMFKTRLNTIGNDFGHFWIFEKNLIFLKTFEDWTLHGTLGKKNFWKMAPKHVQNTFEHYWERFSAFWEFWKILIFLKTFEDWTLHGTLGRKKIRKNCTKTC